MLRIGADINYNTKGFSVQSKDYNWLENYNVRLLISTLEVDFEGKKLS